MTGPGAASITMANLPRRMRPERRAWREMVRALRYDVGGLADVEIGAYGVTVHCATCGLYLVAPPTWSEDTLAGAVRRAARDADAHNLERHPRRARKERFA